MKEVGCSVSEASNHIHQLAEVINEYNSCMSKLRAQTIDATDIPNQNEDLEILEQIVISEEFQNLIDLL